MSRKTDPLTKPATALLRALDKVPPDQRGAALSEAQFVIEQERKAVGDAVKIPTDQWEWFGSPGHFICARDCRFHLCTLIGDYLVSTVGEYLPDESVREIKAESRGIPLEGRGDDRRADYMKKFGFETIGCDRLYETMVFRVTGERCTAEGCGCGLPTIDASELDFDGYNTAGDATRGHHALCAKWADDATRPAETDG